MEKIVMKRGNLSTSTNKRPQPLSKTISLSALLPGDTQFVTQLKTNRLDYITETKDPTVNIRKFPLSLKINIERLNAYLDDSSNHPFNFSLIVRALIYHGINYLESHEEVKSLVSTKSYFDRISDIEDEEDNNELKEMMRRVFDNMELDLFKSGGRDGGRQTIHVTPHIHKTISKLNNQSGIQITDLCLISMVHFLKDEDTTFAGHRKEFSKIESNFIKKINWRSRLLKTIMREFNL